VNGTDPDGFEIRVHAPRADRVALALDGGLERDLVCRGGQWVGSVDRGVRYGLRADGSPDLHFDGRRTLVDPMATEVWFPSGHRRDDARPGGEPRFEKSALAVATPWPDAVAPRPTTRPLVVYETHVRGMTKQHPHPDAGTFRAMIGELPRLAELGVSVVELLPVHQFDPDEHNYWGYMPLVFGAVHRGYAAGDDAAAELADLVAAAHGRDIEIWLDVVFNHTTEEDERGPTYNLRALADGDYYARRADGSYLDEAGTGNVVDATSAPARALVMSALDRFADLGVDGFRFDLATVLARDPDFVRSIGDWGERRGVRLIAEPWDVVRYQVGRAFPDGRWMQWNDRFRDDMRGLLRGEDGLVPALMKRLQGSPDLFDRPGKSVNFLTAHDGFTMYDLVSYDHKRNQANGWDNTDGTDANRSWNCGWEGDDGVPAAVTGLRHRQLRNAMCLLLLSHGTPMFVAGDEFGRTQRGNNNAYNQDNETSWIDWDRRRGFILLEDYVRRMIAFRAKHPVLSAGNWWGSRVTWFGTGGAPDLAPHSRSIAWSVDGIYAMVNMWCGPLTFQMLAPGPWVRCIDTADPAGFVEPLPAGQAMTVEPRSIVVLEGA
jgi:isoamylase